MTENKQHQKLVALILWTAMPLMLIACNQDRVKAEAKTNLAVDCAFELQYGNVGSHEIQVACSDGDKIQMFLSSQQQLKISTMLADDIPTRVVYYTTNHEAMPLENEVGMFLLRDLITAEKSM